MANEKVTLPLETINKVLQFLASQPYGTVAELISEVQKDAQVVEEEAPAPKAKDAK